MPFEPVTVVNKHNRPPQASISYERSQRQTKKGMVRGKLPSLVIAIPTTLSGATKKQHFMLTRGTGKDAGKARITGQNAANGHTVGRKDRINCTMFDFGFVPLLGEGAAAQEHVAVRKVSDDEFEIDLPAWFSADEAAT